MNLNFEYEQVKQSCLKNSLLLLFTVLFFVSGSLNAFSADKNLHSNKTTTDDESQIGKTMNFNENLYLAETLKNQQQSKQITGTVSDENGAAIPGATIIAKGTTNGTITDNDGHFSIKVDKSVTTLTISFVGYTPLDVQIGSKTDLSITLTEQTIGLEEVVAVGYGVQKKETLTGAISSVETEELLRSPNASVANTLAGQITGLTSVQVSGQPGKEDPTIYIRGVGSLSEGSSTPLILVDGVENSFFQMDPNEIESLSVLKDASATAVFGVRGANGVILVTTRRGKEGKAKIQVNSSVGLQTPTRLLEMADSYNLARTVKRVNERDYLPPEQYFFTDYDLERFRLKDDPFLYPDISWRDYLMNEYAKQTQHNVNISGGTKKVRYFASVGFLYQEGLFEKYGDLDYDNNFDYTRFNYRTNLDIDVTNTTTVKIGIGGIVGNVKEPIGLSWDQLNNTQPMASPGVIDGVVYIVDPERYKGFPMRNNVISNYYGSGFTQDIKNTMNLDLVLDQKLDFITKGLSFEVKGAYNTTYKLQEKASGSIEAYNIFYQSEVDGSTLTRGDEGFDYTHVYKITGENEPLKYSDEVTSRGRNWYFETSLRYARKFGNHNLSALALYNQTKKYYPSQFTQIPSGYVGIVGRATYDYKSKYMAEFNVGYNGSENFAPGKRYGLFPAGSIGYVLTEEEFMKSQKLISYIKLRASVGLVGNDKIGGNRFLYLPDGYALNQAGLVNKYKTFTNGYNFGLNSSYYSMGVVEQQIGNPDVTWEKALKQNYGIDLFFLDSRLKLTADVFKEFRKDILISRNTVPSLIGLEGKLPTVNMGKVENKGYELELRWNDKIKNFRYNIGANMSHSMNKIIEMDEIPPREDSPYLSRTGSQVGSIYGYEFERLFTEDDFDITASEDGGTNYTLKDGIASTNNSYLRPGDAKYTDLNDDGVIDGFDQHYLATSGRPDYVFGLNLGANYKGFFASMNWTAVTGRSLQLKNSFAQSEFSGKNIPMYMVEDSWWEETGGQAEYPRMSSLVSDNNSLESDVWIKDGSYIKLKNAVVGYSFNNKALKKYGISKLDVKLTGYNLLTFDRFKIMDPESNPNGNDTYPVVKIYNLGVSVTF